MGSGSSQPAAADTPARRATSVEDRRVTHANTEPPQRSAASAPALAHKAKRQAQSLPADGSGRAANGLVPAASGIERELSRVESGTRPRREVAETAGVVPEQRGLVDPALSDCAVSLEWLLGTFWPAVVKAKGKPWALTASTLAVVEDVVKAQTSSDKSKFVTLVPPNHMGRSQIYLIHHWGGSFSALLTALSDHMRYLEDKELIGQTLVWMDIFAVNQHTVGTPKGAVELAEIERVIDASQHVLLHLDQKGLCTQRRWVCWEVFKGMAKGRKHFQVMSSPKMGQAQRSALTRRVDASLTLCGSARDARRLATAISKLGGYEKVSEVVKVAIGPEKKRGEELLATGAPPAAVAKQLESEATQLKGEDPAAAAELMEEAVSIKMDDLGYDSPVLASMMGDTADLHRKVGNLQLALPMYQAAMRVRKASLGPRCSHYKRCCKLWTPCCERAFWCQHCHDFVMNETNSDPKTKHELDRRAVEEVVCVLCDTRQPITNTCRECKARFAKYYCPTCKLYDDDLSKRIFHCDKCGICRAGGKENYFHCDVCECCFSNAKGTTHKCSRDKMKQKCFLCDELLYSGGQAVSQLKCRHSVHEACRVRLIESGITNCPACDKEAAKTVKKKRESKR